MKQFNNDIKDIFQNVLDQHSTSVEFESVWNRSLSNHNKAFSLKKVITIPLVALITLLAFFTIGFASYSVFRNMDNTNKPFVNDSRVIGKWDVVDFIDKIENFKPDNKSWDGELYVNSMAFIKDGDMLFAAGNSNLAYTPSTWTKNLILNKQEKTASKYKIKEINGITYMFFEWKSGDYVFRNMNPYYYVLKKVDSKDYSDYTVKRIGKEDNVDLPFVDDKQMKGKWQSVDFVETIDNFIPGKKSWLDDLYLTELSFDENGKYTIKTLGGIYTDNNITWTKGLVLNKYEKLASKCIVKEINGSMYLFFEWKNGDYLFRGWDPRYYVLKKVE